MIAPDNFDFSNHTNFGLDMKVARHLQSGDTSVNVAGNIVICHA